MLKNFCEKYFFLVIAISVVLGLFSWDLSKSLFGFIKPMLGIVIFAMSLTLKFEDFKPSFLKPKALLLGVASQYLFMPGLAFVIANLLHLPNEFAIGLILVGSCPGGTVSNVITYIAKADLALSISMTFFSTLVAPIMLPFVMWIFASQWIDINAYALFISTVQIVLLPLIIGLTINMLFKIKESENLNSAASLVSIFLVAIIIHAMVAKNIEKFSEIENITSSLLMIFLAVVLHNLSGYLFTYFFIQKFNLSKAQVRAITFEVGIQNSGLASVLAVIYFSPLSVIPSIFSASWHSLSGSALASYWAKNPEK